MCKRVHRKCHMSGKRVSLNPDKFSIPSVVFDLGPILHCHFSSRSIQEKELRRRNVEQFGVTQVNNLCQQWMSFFSKCRTSIENQSSCFKLKFACFLLNVRICSRRIFASHWGKKRHTTLIHFVQLWAQCPHENSIHTLVTRH